MLGIRFRRKELPWEVVDNKFVDPVPMYLVDEDMDVVSVSPQEMRGHYFFDLSGKNKDAGYRGSQDLTRAVSFARQELMREAAKKGYNVLLIESWQLTILRRAKSHRIEVRYSGRPARCVGNLPSSRNPPCMGILYT